MPLSAQQKSVQSYLDRHDIGKLFEDMMSKLIMERPNEPIAYLMKLLQKVLSRKNMSATNTYPSTVLSKPGMSLAGSSIPLKQSKNPQVVLPGSKSSVQPWLDEATGRTENTGPHVYEKSRLSDSKLSKNLPVKSDKQKEIDNAQPISWNTSRKQQLQLSDDESCGMKSDKKEPIKLAKRWSTNTIELVSNDKENDVRPMNTTKSSNVPKRKSDEDELKPQPVGTANKTKICSPQTYSKFKRKLSKKKSFENREKLQSLLLTNQITASVNDRGSNNDSDYEGEHVFEDVSELHAEGAKAKSSAGVIKKAQPDSNVKVTVCMRCAQVTDLNFQPQSYGNNLFSDSDDLRSVSQLDESKTYKMVPWSPSPTPSHNVDSADSGALDLVSSPNDGDQSDFFQKNDPLKNKSKVVGDKSENETIVRSGHSEMDDEWQKKLGNNDNEVIAEGQGWEQKVLTDIDILSDT